MLATGSIAKGAMVGGYFLSAKALILLTGGLGVKIIVGLVIAMDGYGDERRWFLRKAERSLMRDWKETPNPLETEARERSAILTDIRSLRTKAEKGWRTPKYLLALLRVLKASTIPLLEDGANATYDIVEDVALSLLRFGKDFWGKLTKEV